VADLESSLAQVKLDAAELLPCLRPLLYIPLPEESAAILGLEDLGDMAVGGTKLMQPNTFSSSIVFKRITAELKEYAVIAIYLYICFTAILFLKSTILKAHGVEFAPFGFAAIKALISAKFVSVGHIFRIGERFKLWPLIWPTLYKALAFLILLLVLNALEQIIDGVIRQKSLANSLSDFGGGTFGQLIATSFVVFLILVPFFAFRALGEVIGEDNLVKIFFLVRRPHG
jgi:hypothetical protein